MSNILIWIDSSIKLEQKIIKLNNVLSHKYKNIVFVSKDRKTKSFFLKKGLSIFSMEEIIKKLTKINSIEYDDIFPNDIDENILKGVLSFSSYRDNILPFPLDKNYRDPYSQIAILKKFWVSILKEKNISDTLILNGISINSFSLALSSYFLGKKIYFWENGLLPRSIFISRSGVNAFSNVHNFLDKEINELIFSNLDDILFSSFNKYKNYKKNILVTLQVDCDSNIKCFSPFFGIKEFLVFLAKTSKGKIYLENNLRIRTHPKFKLKKKFLNSLFKENIQISSFKLNQDFNWADFVFTINSTTGLEAILKNKCLICFGNSYYSKFLRYKNFKYFGKIIKVFIFDPSNNIDCEIRKKLINSLNFNSLKLENSDKNWLDILKKLEMEETKPYFTNNFFNQFLYSEKFINIAKENKNLLIIEKIISKIISKVNQLFETFS